jgi:peptidoglycan hydrolase-like amidase
MLAVFASLLAIPLAAPASPALAAEREQCTQWSSRTEPPRTIRVYRVSEGQVDTVDFKHYVFRVVSREWNVDNRELRKAGAHAVKQYAWFHVLRWRGGTYNGQCYDVKDTTADQLYANKPLENIPDRVKKAVNATWTWRLWRGDKFIGTGYRRGKDVPCAYDAGYKLFVRSARKCAARGWSAERILKVYYTARLEK